MKGFLRATPRLLVPALVAVVAGLDLVGCGSSEPSDAAFPPASTVEDGGAADAQADSAVDAAVEQDAAVDFTFTSPAFQDQGTLPMEHTCDGAGTSPPLAWSGIPAGTAELALLMTTVAPDGVKWNWVLYGIPKDVSSLAAASTGIGTAGVTSDGPQLAYAPPCSKGPGPKAYTFTLYALSEALAFSVPPAKVSGPVVEAAAASVTIAKRTIVVTYTRP